ncbi:MAG: hypothetical protein CME55_06510 [Halieaceae bacterium]|nr:hypothetical protein [Halieaceae bacterium]|tara:strand:+ start:637 stop:2085 length:1449 start_codon:yes stop_codon:yes gene_type:complete
MMVESFTKEQFTNLTDSLGPLNLRPSEKRDLIKEIQKAIDVERENIKATANFSEEVFNAFDAEAGRFSDILGEAAAKKLTEIITEKVDLQTFMEEGEAPPDVAVSQRVLELRVKEIHNDVMNFHEKVTGNFPNTALSVEQKALLDDILNPSEVLKIRKVVDHIKEQYTGMQDTPHITKLEKQTKALMAYEEALRKGHLELKGNTNMSFWIQMNNVLSGLLESQELAMARIKKHSKFSKISMAGGIVPFGEEVRHDISGAFGANWDVERLQRIADQHYENQQRVVELISPAEIKRIYLGPTTGLKEADVRKLKFEGRNNVRDRVVGRAADMVPYSGSWENDIVAKATDIAKEFADEHYDRIRLFGGKPPKEMERLQGQLEMTEQRARRMAQTLRQSLDRSKRKLTEAQESERAAQEAAASFEGKVIYDDEAQAAASVLERQISDIDQQLAAIKGSTFSADKAKRKELRTQKRALKQILQKGMN